MLSGCTKQTQISEDRLGSPTPTETASANPEMNRKQISLSSTFKEHKDERFAFSFSYPDNLNFELQSPYPGGIIKDLTFRVDGITESTLLYKDLQKSLLNNDLYCNMDTTGGGVTCKNERTEEFVNAKGTKGIKVFRTKEFDEEDSETPTKLDDIVYVFPLLKGAKTSVYSPYLVIVFSVKIPSKNNLDFLDQIVQTVVVE